MKKWVVGIIISYLIILFSLVSGIQFSNRWTIGDYIFKFANQAPWSNGSSGTHYSVIAALILLLVGVICLRFSLESAPSSLHKRINIITLIMILGWPFFTDAGQQLVMRNSTGINAIEYNRKISSCILTVRDDGRILVSADLSLTNHGEKPVTFYMKIKSPTKDEKLKRFFGNGLVLRNMDNTIETFVLEPKEVRKSCVESYAVNPSGLHVSLSMGKPIVVIYNEQAEKTFAR